MIRRSLFLTAGLIADTSALNLSSLPRQLQTGDSCSNEDLVVDYAGLVGFHASGHALFGAQEIQSADLPEATVVVAAPLNGCSALQNAADMPGKIALIRRGSCTFTAKVLNAQNAGAVAAIIYNSGYGMVTMGGSHSGITIPSVFIDRSHGEAMSDAVTADPTIIVNIHCSVCASSELVVDYAGGFHASGHALFGAREISANTFSETTVVVAAPLNGCSALQNAADMPGKITLIRRGSCTFTTKVWNAQDAGAVAAIVYNDHRSGLVQMSGSWRDTRGLSILAIFIDGSHGDELNAAVTADPTIVVNIHCDTESNFPACTEGSIWTNAPGGGMQCTPCVAGTADTDESPGTPCIDCPAGTHSDAGAFACTDQDDCAPAPCFTGVACHDLPAPQLGYTCSACPSGFSGDGETCVDIDGCANGPCGSGSCTDTGANSYDCVCDDGFTLANGVNGLTCAEIRPCDTGEHDCDINAICNHEGPGSHSCTCSAGYTGTGIVCVDTDGCSEDPCFTGVRCADVAAPNDGYVCGACPDGFSGDGETCVDIDDCNLMLVNTGAICGGFGTCTDSGVNSYECACDVGYLFASGTCEEIRPCDADETNDCHAHATCNHEGPGSHSCTCNAGYSGSGVDCVDTDGCADGPCFAGVECFDTVAPGDGYSCDECPSGFNGDGKECHDIWDCVDNPCGPNGSCTDAGANAYECSCDPGWRDFGSATAGTGTVCEEVFPCDLDEDDCHANAICNHQGPGQHSCSCETGYTGDGQTCVDTDGCAEDPCFAGVDCTDISAPGEGFTCGECPEGMVDLAASTDVQGVMCHDPDCDGSPCGLHGDCVDTGIGSYTCDCDANYRVDVDGSTGASTCAEIRPCDTGEHDCDINAICNHEGPGSYSCTCSTGYTGDGVHCSDQDDCAPAPCFTGVACHDLPAPQLGYTCSACPSGFSGDGETCVDIDDCANGPCGSGSCTDTGANSYDCVCDDGFTLANGVNGLTCAEIRPCDTGEHDCDINAICNHEGPGRHSCTCSAGYTGTGIVCVDTDGCSEDPCFTGVRCADVAAPNDGYVCGACPDGFSGDGETCVDIDDCNLMLVNTGAICGGFGTCTDSGVNSYECACDVGYLFASGTCEEIRPCDADETNDCHAHATCNHEGPGSHSCTCNAGYSGSGVDCVDTDGCADGPCFAGVECFDTVAPGDGYSCDECPSGFNGDGKECHDIWDCVDNPCGPNGSCTDAGANAYECSCDPGWRDFGSATAGTGTVCEEVFPCDLDEDDCHANAICNHQGPGQHSCSCETGYTGDGQTCVDTDGCAEDPCFAGVDCTDISAPGEGFTCGECPEGMVDLAASTDVQGVMCHDPDCDGSPCGLHGDCVDTGIGSYTCDCDANYRVDVDGSTGASTCAEIRPCDTGEHDCDINAICNHEGPGSYSCTCSTGYTGDGVHCSDQDDCAPAPCFTGVACHDLPAPQLGYTCSACPSGFSGDGETCVDIDDCANGPCGSGSCTDTGANSYDCVCDDGFTLANGVNGLTCAEIRPCDTGEHDCDINAICNHEGPGRHSCTCSAGYTGTGIVCVDTDGCSEDPCFSGVRCADVAAPNDGYVCGACPDGFSGDGETCVDIDDCNLMLVNTGAICGGFGTCTDSGVNSYECACDVGYLFASGTCEEIRPCDADETNDCHAHATCNHEGPGSHSCTCNAGYSGSGVDCVDTDGCADGPCFAGVECFDTVAPGDGYSCDECPSGFNGDGKECHDIWDCVDNPCGPNGSCTDAGANAYECSCDPGWRDFGSATAGTGTVCEEVFPCDLDEDDCHANAICNHQGPGQHSCSCETGYTGDGQTCVDTDGCAEDPCFAGVDCTDISAPGEGFTCGECPEGMVDLAASTDVQGVMCHDPDCDGSPCGLHGDCVDTGIGSYTCDCDANYRVDVDGSTGASTCAEIRPCDTGEHDCDINAICNHEGPGSYSCTCSTGYTGDGVHCSDQDDCAPAPCFTGVACHDLPAPQLGYTCSACPSGFSGDGETCVDIDDCANGPCGSGSCTDTGANSYDCVCDDGFTLANGANGLTCAEIRPCDTGEHDCDINAICNHEGPGSHSCTCSTGYTGDGVHCSDQDDCAPAPCFTGVACHDLPAPQLGYTCSACPSGFSGDGETCVDIDDCANGPCGSGSCTDTGANSYDCVCDDGFTLANGVNGLTCAEIRPCDTGEHDCDINAICNHEGPGSHSCTCSTGYTGDGVHCSDQDDCAPAPCFTGVACHDLPAPQLGYTCSACPSGFSGDGETCVDIDDCANGPCGSGSCTDTGANSYDCVCDDGFTLANGVNGLTCAEIRPCDTGEHDCDINAICNHEGPGRHSCTCSAGYTGTGIVCADTDGCADAVCSSVSSCIDVTAPGDGYTCDACPVGYVGNGTICTDLAEVPTVQESIALDGGVSPEDFVAGLLVALSESEDGEAPVIIIDSFETEVNSEMTLPGDPEQFVTDGSPARDALTAGLQAASCGLQPVDVCSVAIAGVSRRRLQSSDHTWGRRHLQTSTNVEFTVAATVDVSDAVKPSALSTAFVAAVQADPNGALSTLSSDDVVAQEPEITTVVVYTVVMPDEETAEAAAAILANDAAVAQGVSTAAPGVSASPNQPSPLSMEPVVQTPPVSADHEGSRMFGMLAIFIVVATLGVGAAIQHQRIEAGKQSGIPLFSRGDPTAAGDGSEVASKFSNPLMSPDEPNSSDEDESDDEENQQVDVAVDPSVVSGQRYRALAPGIIRSGIDLDSDKAGSLIVGEVFVALAAAEFGGKQRIQTDRGWVSFRSKTGKVVLEQVHAGEELDVEDMD